MTCEPSLVTSKRSVPEGASSVETSHASSVEVTVTDRASPSDVPAVPVLSVQPARAGTASTRGTRVVARGREIFGRTSGFLIGSRLGAGTGRRTRCRKRTSTGTTYATQTTASQPGRLRGEVEDALEQGAEPAARADDAGDVEGVGAQAGQHARLLEIVEAVGQHPGGHDDQQRAGPGEEAGQVDADRAAVEQPAEQHGDGDAEQSGDDRGGALLADGVAGGLPGVAPRIREVSSPSRPTARTATRTRPQAGPSAVASTRPRGRPPIERAALAIQKIIQVTKPAATIDSEPPMISWVSKVSWRACRPRPTVSAAQEPSASATPSQIRGSRCRRPEDDEVGDQDARHEGGLEPLAQADQEVSEHPPDTRPSASVCPTKVKYTSAAAVGTAAPRRRSRRRPSRPRVGVVPGPLQDVG